MARRTLLGAAAAALLLLPGALASHMSSYANNAVEHDGLGAVPEPDGLSTSLLGPALTNCVLDLPPFQGRCMPDPVPRPAGALGSVLAPGCTGGDAAAERKPDGQCGLYTVGIDGYVPGVVPEPLAEHGMAGNAAPGAYTPTKQSQVRFLDGRLTTTVQQPNLPTTMVDVNRKLAEAGRLAGAGLPGAGNVLPGPSLAWAWYGQWQDRNGNGVIDHHNRGGPVANEFAWLGGCLDFTGSRDANSIARGVCIEDPNPNSEPPGTACGTASTESNCALTTLDVWMFPGNHPPSGLVGPPGFPGAQVGAFLYDELLCQTYILCCPPGPPFCDGGGDPPEAPADPLLDDPDAATPEFGLDDRTGDPGDTTRQWAGPSGWTTFFWGDDGLLVTMVEVYGVNCRAAPASANGFDLASCTFLDVDRHAALDPTVEEQVVGLKAQARAAWALVREAWPL